MQKFLTIQNQTLRFLTQLACLLSLLALASCGGSSTSDSAPSITSLTAATSTTITLNDSVDITPVFIGGTGTTATVDNIVGAVTSGVSFNVTPTATTTFTLTVSSPKGTVTQSITITVVDAPTISSFTTLASTVTLGDSTDLTAVFTGGNGDIDNSIGAVTSAIAKTVTPTALGVTTYQITVTNAAGLPVTSTVDVTAITAPTISSFTASTSTVTIGSSTDLTAVFADGTGSIDNSVGAVTSTVAKTVTPIALGVTTYQITVTNTVGTSVTSTVNVTAVATPTITSFTASASIVTLGNSTDLTAVFADGTGSIDNTVGAVSSTVAKTVTPIALGTTTYIITVTNTAGDTVTDTIDITVVAAPSISSFTATASPITLSETTDFTAVFTNGTGSIDNSVGAVTSTIAKTVTPIATGTTTYTITVTNAAGDSVTDTIDISVIAAPVISSYSPSTGGAEVAPGTVVNLTPTFTTDGTASIDQGVGAVTSGVAEAVTVNNTTTYTLTVTNSLGFQVTSSITVVVTTVTGSAQLRTLSNNSSIVLLFNRSMNSTGALGTLTFTGDLSGQVNTSVWSNFGLTDNLLTISPTASWTSGIDKTLIIDAEDTFGNTVTLNLTFDVAAGSVFFVNDTAADDSGDGLSVANAKLTINAAISAASSGDLVAVNQGSYPIDSGVNNINAIVLKENVSLLGSYKNNFSVKDTILFETIVTDTSSTITSDATAPNAVIQASAGITSATIVSGFTLNGSTNTTADFTSVILITAGANPIIENNIINAGGDSTNDTSYGIYTDSSDPTIRNNLIHGGVSSSSYGLNINTATAAFILRNNTINAGSGNVISHGIENTVATPKVENNIIFSSGGAGSNICYFEADATIPDTLFNNYFLNCSTALYNKNAGGCAGGSTCLVSEVEIIVGAAKATNNVETADATFANFTDIDGLDNNVDTMIDNDWRISVTSPAAGAGLNGIDASFGFTKDLDGVTRPASAAPWSIGAYEP